MGVQLHDRAIASVDYAHEDGRDVFRQALVWRTASTSGPITGVRLEAYQRVSAGRGSGLNASADLRFGKLAVTTGIMSVDRRYVPTFNGDRYGIGKRWYSIGTYPVTPSATLRVCKEITGAILGAEAPDPARREEGEYPVYSTDEQRRGAGCLGGQNASVISLQALIGYHTRAFDNDFFVPVHHRFDLILVINPTAALKRAGVF